MKKLFIFLLVVMKLSLVHAEEGGNPWYEQRALFDPDRPYLYYPDQEAKSKKPEPKLPQTPQEAQAALEQLQESLKLSRALAVMNPSSENIKSYIQMQEIAMEKSSVFADQWRRTLWANPQLDYSLKGRPTQQLAIQMYDKNRDMQTDDIIKYVAQNQGLIWFVRSDCSYCHAFAPILQQLKQAYGMRIMTVSLDGRGVPGFEDALPDNGIATRLGVSVTPTLFIADTKNRQYIPLGAGFMSMQELTNRFNVVFSQAGSQF